MRKTLQNFRFILVLSVICLFFHGVISNVVAMEVVNNELRIPTSEITLIWEHYCMKHMAHGEWHLARLNQKAIEFQKTREYWGAETDALSHFQEKLKEARAAKEISAGSWGCNPSKAKLAFVQLNVGQIDKTQISESFISNTNHSLEARAAVLVDSDCKEPKLEWEMSAQKYGIQHRINEANLTAADGNKGITIPSSGLSDDETVFGCTGDPKILGSIHCGYIVYEVNVDSFNLMSTLERTLAIPEALHGDRGDNFKVDVGAKLFCDGVLSDKVSVGVVQDEKDQLRQEYVDMEKKIIPKWEELIDKGDTAHFSVSQFNASQKVGGGEYKYILCKVLDKLEKVRSKAGNIPMTINSGFRNPYKHHVKLGLKTKESPHLYGMAADISLDDFNGDKKIDETDRVLINTPAKVLGACIEPANKTKTWIHLDWRGTCPPGW